MPLTLTRLRMMARQARVSFSIRWRRIAAALCAAAVIIVGSAKLILSVLSPAGVDLLVIASTISAAIFAGIGAATETKHGGRLTRWGWISLLGVIISAGLALGMRRVEMINANRTAALERERHDVTYRQLQATLSAVNKSLDANNEINRNVLRLLQPVTMRGIQLSLGYPADDAIFVAWLKRVRAVVKASKNPDRLLGPLLDAGGIEALAVQTEIEPRESDAAERDAYSLLYVVPGIAETVSRDELRSLDIYVSSRGARCYTIVYMTQAAFDGAVGGLIIQRVKCSNLKLEFLTSRVRGFIDLPGCFLGLHFNPSIDTYGIGAPDLLWVRMSDDESFTVTHDLPPAMFERDMTGPFWSWRYRFTTADVNSQ